MLIEIRVVPSLSPAHARIEKAYGPGLRAYQELGVRWEDIPDLITKLRRAHNEHVASTTPTP